MQWLQNFFKKKSTFLGDPIQTGEELLSLAVSNQVVAAELAEFESRLKEGNITCVGRQEQEAFKSAEALSGYGIAVAKEAFLETLES